MTVKFPDIQPGDYVTVWRPIRPRDVPPVISLRHLLKAPLRDGFEHLGQVHRFRCVDIRQIPADAAAAQETTLERQVDE